jgi:phage terminase large subunit-like protein
MQALPPEKLSSEESLLLLSEDERSEALSSLTDSQFEELRWQWRGWQARPNQLRPPGTWTYWLLMAGRGFGKTRTGAETVREWVTEGARRIHLVGPTASDVRNVMVQSLLSCFPPHQRPLYEPTKHWITFHTGAVAETFTADEPERLRGPQCERFWADELAAWRFGEEAWNNLMFGFRVGTNLQGVITTTPKPIPLVHQIIKDPSTVVTRASTYENAGHLAPAFFRSVVAKYEGSRLGRQELLAELLEDIPGALWSRGLIEATRWRQYPSDDIVRTVVSIDPAVTAGEDSDETGIVVVSLLRNGHVIVLDDLSCRESPLGWARIAVASYHSRRADRIVGEVNNGGDLVEGNIRAVAPNVSYRAVRASRGKAVRAEPVAALYEQGRVHHVGCFGALEDQMCSFVPGIDPKADDRMDALVWGVTELLIDLDDTPQWEPAVLPVVISRY